MGDYKAKKLPISVPISVHCTARLLLAARRVLAVCKRVCLPLPMSRPLFGPSAISTWC